MKTTWKIGIAMILITAVLAFTGYAVASAGSTWMRGMGGGNISDSPMMAGEGGILQAYMADAWAQVLDMSEDEVNALLDQGLTHLEIALQAGWTEEDLPGLMQAAMAIAAASAQADGVITQEQAQFMLQRMNRMQNFGDCEDCEEYQHRFMRTDQDGQNWMHQNMFQNQDCEDCEANQYQNMEKNSCGEPGTYGPGMMGPNGRSGIGPGGNRGPSGNGN